MSTPSRNPIIVLAIFALLGALFAAVSTHDFVVHLDRQVHAITCSFVPGLGAPDVAGTSGCHAALMSPYSSVLRSWTWGGIPISLGGLAVFAFLLFRALDLLLRREEIGAEETRFLVVATALPVLVSVIYFLVSVLRVGELCNLCVAIYIASLGCFVAAVIAHRRSTLGQPAAVTPWATYTLYFVEGIIFVVLPVLLYLLLKPAYPDTMARCGELLHPEDRYGVRVKLAGPPGGVPAVEVLDPLCPACKGFSLRLSASGLAPRLAREMVLFPLDGACNWMVTDSVHPGSCILSEAVLAAGPQAEEVLAWVFAHQAELRELGRTDQNALIAQTISRFPQLAGAIDSPAVRSKLNRSLRWVVSNSLSVLTPQLFVNGEKICDEDTDLGLEYVLTRKLAEQRVTSAPRPGR